MKKLVFLLVLLTILTVACGKKTVKEATVYHDGSYTGESTPDEWGGKIVVHLKIKDEKIVTCTMENLNEKGEEKGEDYGKTEGKITNPGLYQIAQNAIALAKEYPKELVETQDLQQVEVISGATVSHIAFQEAVTQALSQAGKQ